MVFKNGVVNIQAAGHNGARTVDKFLIIISGCDFIPSNAPGGKTLKITATLDSRETLQTEPIEFKNETPDFNTELVWTMSRLTFQHLRSRKALLKLHLVENDANEGSEKNVGNFQFDLKEAIPSAKPLDNPEESYIVVRTCVLYKNDNEICNAINS